MLVCARASSRNPRRPSDGAAPGKHVRDLPEGIQKTDRGYPFGSDRSTGFTARFETIGARLKKGIEISPLFVRLELGLSRQRTQKSSSHIPRTPENATRILLLRFDRA